MKLTTVLPDVFGSLADDIERNEKSWKDVGTLIPTMLVEYSCYAMPCSGLIWMLQNLRNFLEGTKKASQTYKVLCFSDAFVWIVSIEPLPILSLDEWESNTLHHLWSAWRVSMISPPLSLPLCSS